MAKLDLIISNLRQRIRASGFRAGDMIPSQKELAQELGVSVVTVGQAMRCLQQEGMIASTRGKGTVVTPARSNGHGPNLVYGLLVTAANINDPVLAQPISALEQACEAAGRELRIFPCNQSRLTREQLRAWADGVAACFILGTTKPVLVESLAALGKPVIFYGEFYREPCPPWAGQITVNIEATSLMCLQFLMSLGHRNILLVRSGGTSYLESLGLFFAKSAMQLGCGHTLKQLTVPLDVSGEEVVQAMQEEYTGVTALIVDGGMRASRILHALTSNGVRIPEDLSVLAINGVNANLLITPDLSRVDNINRQLGERLLTMADEMIASGLVFREHMIPHLVWGKTCRNIAPTCTTSRPFSPTK